MHSPVYDKKGGVSATSIVNTDIHDIARCARTFGVRRFYIVTPIPEQQNLVQTILKHWQSGFGSRHNPDRKEAFSLVKLKDSLDEVMADVVLCFGEKPRVVVTGARIAVETLKVEALREILSNSGNPILLLFGTGWGLAEEVIEKADYRLAPIRGTDNYNHLPVRSAVAIILDRLRGR
ncbi:MAG: RNA methyltransferase [Syntrophaceae bacterium]|nr:RNA methyltransferase [Syntrophaceae bacterium]